MILKCLDMVIEFWIEVVSVSGVLAAGKNEVDLVAFEVDLNEGRLDQVGDILQMNGGGLVRTLKSLLFIQPGGFSGAFGVVREIHRASECSLQGLLRPID